MMSMHVHVRVCMCACACVCVCVCGGGGGGTGGLVLGTPVYNTNGCEIAPFFSSITPPPQHTQLYIMIITISGFVHPSFILYTS